MTLRRFAKEDKSIPPAMMDAWRSKGLSEAEMRRLSLCDHASGLMANLHPIDSVISPVADLQWRKGKELVDLTWSEALEAFLEDRRKDLDESVNLRREFGEKDYSLEVAQKQILKVSRRAREVYDEWLAKRESGLRGGILTSYRAKVRGYYGDDEASKREQTTKRARQKAKRLKRDLDEDSYAVELRKKLEIPDRGFQDVDQAACWLYDRYPAVKDVAPYGPEHSMHEYGPREIPEPAIMQVSVLAEATRRLRKRYEEEHEVKLEPAWDFLLCFYLLRGKLHPLPRKIVGRKRPKREKHERICQLYDRHQHAFKAALSYDCGLTDADWAEIGQKEPAAKGNWIPRGKRPNIEEEAEKIAKREGRTLRPRKKWISEAYVRQVRHRMERERKT